MNILVTGARGFVGTNLIENLKTIRDGTNRTRPGIKVDEVFEFDVDSSISDLNYYCRNADFIFNLAGVNRPENSDEFRKGNCDFISTLLNRLKEYGNRCPIMMASSVQATLAGRFGTSEYGITKRDGEELLYKYAEETGTKVLIYRFPNLAGKWCRPNYNSAIATFCHNIANDIPVSVNDANVELEILFIDDLIEEMFDALEGSEHRCDYPKTGETIDGVEFDGVTPVWRENGSFCGVPTTHKATLGYIVECLEQFADQPKTVCMPSIPKGSFEKKLYSVFLSYLPEDKVAFDLEMKTDNRGSFTEMIKTLDHGQFSVNISKPGITKGQHWHNSKWELFIVVSGHALIQERRIGIDPETGGHYGTIEFEVSGERIQAVHMLPGYTHSITNLSDTADLVTVMWANEIFEENRPDTYGEMV